MKGLLTLLLVVIVWLFSNNQIYANNRFSQNKYQVNYDQHESFSFETNSSDTTKSRITPGVPSKYDWIRLTNGEEREVEVRKISDKYVYISKPGDMDMEWIDRREVQTIYYRSGRVEPMTEKEVTVRQVKDWKDIKTTTKPADVEGMIRVEDLEVRMEASTRHHHTRPSTLESSAEIVLKKNAALLNADIVLITRKDHHRAYGEAPSIYMTGVAYRER